MNPRNLLFRVEDDDDEFGGDIDDGAGSGGDGDVLRVDGYGDDDYCTVYYSQFDLICYKSPVLYQL